MMACRDEASDFPPKSEAKSIGVPRRSFEILGSNLLSAFANSFGATDFASLQVRSEVWWRRRESNPRPRTFPQNIYIHSLSFKISFNTLPRQDSLKVSL